MNKTADMKTYMREYMRKNSHYYTEKIQCECGGKYDRTTKARHMMTNKHRKWVTNQIQETIHNGLWE